MTFRRRTLGSVILSLVWARVAQLQAQAKLPNATMLDSLPKVVLGSLKLAKVDREALAWP